MTTTELIRDLFPRPYYPRNFEILWHDDNGEELDGVIRGIRLDYIVGEYEYQVFSNFYNAYSGANNPPEKWKDYAWIKESDLQAING